MNTSPSAGSSYTATVHVINITTALGQPAPATLSVSLAAAVGSSVFSSSQQSFNFDASEAHDFQFSVVVPSNVTGTGAIAAVLNDPNGNQLATGNLTITVSQPTPDFNVGLSFGGGPDSNGAIVIDAFFQNPTSQKITHTYTLWYAPISNPTALTQRGWGAPSGGGTQHPATISVTLGPAISDPNPPNRYGNPGEVSGDWTWESYTGEGGYEWAWVFTPPAGYIPPNAMYQSQVAAPYYTPQTGYPLSVIYMVKDENGKTVATLNY